MPHSKQVPPTRVNGETVPRWDVAQIVSDLRVQRARWRDAHQRPREGAGREFPSPRALRAIMDGLRGALFPMRLGPAGLHQEGEDTQDSRNPI
jgi:serine O-acetyltransferase